MRSLPAKTSTVGMHKMQEGDWQADGTFRFVYFTNSYIACAYILANHRTARHERRYG